MNVHARALLLAQAFFFSTPLLFAHGGSYTGPGDTVPPGGSGTGTGTSTGSQPPGSSTGTGTGSSTGTPTTGTPPGVPTGQGRGRGTGPQTGPGGDATDTTTWEYWWIFNRHDYLRLKEHVHATDYVTRGGDDFFSGTNGARGVRDTLRPSDEVVRAKVVPALVRALETERSNDVVTGALIALAKIGDEVREDGTSTFAETFAKFLPDANQEISETAAVALGILAHAGSVDMLTELAFDTEPGRKLVARNEVPMRTRAFAVYGLGLTGAATSSNELRQRIVRSLARLLAEPEGATRDLHVAAISALGLTPLAWDPDAALALSSDPSRSRETQIEWLASYASKDGRHPHVRAHAPTALARLLEGAPAPARDRAGRLLLDLLAAGTKQHHAVCQSAALALGRIMDSDQDALDVETRRVLTALAANGDYPTSHFACISLAMAGGRPGSGPDPETGRDDVRRTLLGHLRGSSHMRTWAGLAIGVMEHALTQNGVTPGSASRTMKDSLREELAALTTPERVGAFAIGLGLAGDKDAIVPLRKRLTELGDAAACGYVAVALGLLGDPESVLPIQTIVDRSKYQPELLHSAAVALGILGDKEMVPKLCGMLSLAKSLSSQAAIASGLGQIGDSRSIDPLAVMLADAKLTASARGFAAVALGIVADKELLPWNAKLSRGINYLANTTTLTGEQGTGILDLL